MIQLRITSTAKPYGKDQEFSRFNDDLRNFRDMDEVKAYLKEQYPKAKKSKIYVDTPAGAKHVGYIYRFKSIDCSVPAQRWIQEDWVEFREVETITPPRGV